MVDCQPFPWTRRVVALDEPAVLDRRGWPVTLKHAGRGAGRPLAVLRDLPLLVLRAEWGAGKSIAFEQEHADLLSLAVALSSLMIVSSSPPTRSGDLLVGWAWKWGLPYSSWVSNPAEQQEAPGAAVFRVRAAVVQLGRPVV
jgi:hypothetical protein